MPRLGPLFPLLLVALACDDAGRGVAPVMGQVPAFGISDGAHAGGGAANGDFFFLPPLVPDPSGALAYDQGAFDAGRAPRVVVCRLTSAEPRECETTVRVFAASEIAVSGADEQYHVNWHTDEDGLATDQYYRIAIQEARHAHDGAERWHTLGYADVDPAETGKELRNVVTGEYIGLVDGRTLPIKFRIERSPRCEGRTDCGEAVVTDDGGRVETTTGYAVAEFPEGWLPEGHDVVIVRISRVAIGDGEGESSSCHGWADPPLGYREYEGCYDFETYPEIGTFAKPASVSTCLAAAAGAGDPPVQLYASDPGVPARRLPPTTIAIECAGFDEEEPATTIGFLDRLGRRSWRLAEQAGRALAPRPLYAVDMGRGGSIDDFSHVGWAQPATTTLADPEGDVLDGVVGSTVSLGVRVVSSHTTTSTGPLGLAGYSVSYAVTAPDGSTSTLAATTDGDGHASVALSLAVAGSYAVVATAAQADGAATFSIAASSALPDEVLLTFDTDPDGAAIAPGTVVSQTYAAWGVTLAKASAGTCGTGTAVYANSHGPLPGGGFGFDSGNNTVSVCGANAASDFNETYFGTITATFAESAVRACIDVWPTAAGGVAFLEALDASGAIAARTESAAGVAETICVQPTSGVHGVRFSGKGALHAIFDDMRVTFTDPIIE